MDIYPNPKPNPDPDEEIQVIINKNEELQITQAQTPQKTLTLQENNEKNTLNDQNKIQNQIETLKIPQIIQGDENLQTNLQTQNSVKNQKNEIYLKTINVQPIQQKIIIKNLMIKEYGTLFKGIYHKSNVGKLKQQKYIISSLWWKQWCEHVSFSSGEEQLILNHPGKIENKQLIDHDKTNKYHKIILKDNILEHYDYEVIPKKIYSYLQIWYGIDYSITRQLKIDPSQSFQECLVIDLYPEKILQNVLPCGIRKRIYSKQIIDRLESYDSVESDFLYGTQNDDLQQISLQEKELNHKRQKNIKFEQILLFKPKTQKNSDNCQMFNFITNYFK